jgi:16S rRNA (cytosine1402-N4)-methyltransferase
MLARPEFHFVGLDCDADALAYGEKEFAADISAGRLRLIRGNFSDLKKITEENKISPVVGCLLDLGVSSPQLDESHRGFSFYHSGPLDMRMDHSLDFTAADIVNTWDEDGLNQLFQTLGEVRNPYRVTKKILEMRKEKEFTTTGELSQLIEKSMGWQKKGHHPATQFFLALRLEVNQELARLEKALPEIVSALAPGGRFLVITFHSLEDRIVKVAFKKMASDGLGELVNKKVIQAEWNEKKNNPRARSAKLRIFQKML